MAVTSPVAGENATSRRFRRDVFQARAQQLGADTIAKQAALVGLTRQHLHRIFSGEFKPGVDTLDRMSLALDMSIDEFFPRA